MTTLRRAVASAARQSFAGLKLSSAARTSIEAASALGRRRESNFIQEPPRPHRVPQQVHRQVVVERTRAVSAVVLAPRGKRDRKSTRLNSSHSQISYAVFCLKKKKKQGRYVIG